MILFENKNVLYKMGNYKDNGFYDVKGNKTVAAQYKGA
jgi:hypothetical protein